MGRESGLVDLRGDGGNYDCGTVLVTHIILYYQNRPYTTLLRTNNRTQVCIIYVSSLHYHIFSYSSEDSYPIRSVISSSRPISARVMFKWFTSRYPLINSRYFLQWNSLRLHMATTLSKSSKLSSITIGRHSSLSLIRLTPPFMYT